MNPSILAVVALRAAALSLSLAGKSSQSAAFTTAADAVEAGVATDEHMQLIADKLKSGPLNDSDWDELATRISEDRAALHQD